jgi:hypothetical protein
MLAVAMYVYGKFVKLSPHVVASGVVEHSAGPPLASEHSKFGTQNPFMRPLYPRINPKKGSTTVVLTNYSSQRVYKWRNHFFGRFP